MKKKNAIFRNGTHVLEPNTFSAVQEIQLDNQRVERLLQRRAVGGRVGESYHHR